MKVQQKNPDKLRLLKFFAGIATFLIVLVWNFVNSENELEHVSYIVDKELLPIEGVSTQLESMYARESEIILMINSEGLPNSVLSYKSELIDFVCNDSVLRSHIDAGKRVSLNMSAYDREDYKNVNVKITRGRCDEGT